MRTCTLTVKSRFAADVTVRDELPPIAHGFTHFTLTLHPQRVSARRWPSRAETSGTIWLAPADARGAALPAPIKKLLRSLERLVAPRRSSPRAARIRSTSRSHCMSARS